MAAAMDRPWSRTQWVAALEDPATRAWLVEQGGDPSHESPGGGVAGRARPVGFVIARRVLDLLEIDLVGVDPLHRRQGIAGRLLSHVIASEAGRGAREIQLELAASNEAAFHLYSRSGFVVVGRRSRYYPDGDDAVLLTKVIR